MLVAACQSYGERVKAFKFDKKQCVSTKEEPGKQALANLSGINRVWCFISR